MGPGNGTVVHSVGLGTRGYREYRSEARQQKPLRGLGEGTRDQEAQKVLLADPSFAEILSGIEPPRENIASIPRSLPLALFMGSPLRDLAAADYLGSHCCPRDL